MSDERAPSNGRGGARIAVAAGCALLAACLAGTPLLVSASASGAVQLQVEQTCASELALRHAFSDQESLDYLNSRAGDLKFAAAPKVTTLTQGGISIGGLPDGIDRPALLINTDGQRDQVSPPLPELGLDKIAMPRDVMDRMGAQVGEQLTLSGPPPGGVDPNGLPLPAEALTVTVTVAAAFDPLPYQPAPSFWCGLSGAYEPTPSGDPPRRAMVLASRELVDTFQWVGTWEVRLADKTFTRREAEQTRDSFTQLTADYARFLHLTPTDLNQTGEPDPVATMIARAASLAGAVDKAVQPVRIVGVLTVLLVLLAASVMLARERRRELRLLALRGLSPWRGWVRLVRAVALPVLTGSAIGLVLAIVGVRALGATPQLEPDRVRMAIIAVVVGAMISTGVVAAVATMVGDRFVDTRARHHRWRWVPFELPVVVAAILSARSLSNSGGMRMFGVEARGGQLLAQAFPQLAIATGVVVLARPTAALLRRLRVVGGGLPRGLRLGVRRIVMEVAITTTMLLAVALASGSFVLAGILSASADQQLVDKASVYLGSDLAINLNGAAEVPASFADRATAVQRVDGNFGDVAVDVLGIDPNTLAAAVHWRDDAADQSLNDLLDSIRWHEGDTVVPAIVIGDGAPDVGQSLVVVSGAARREFAVSAVATAEFFPGYKQGTVLVVVDADALATAPVSVSHAIWVRNPPADASEQVIADGGRVRSSVRVQDVFDVLSYSAQRWSYTALGAFGILVACTVITLQLLVVEARRETRRLSHLMLSRMGFTSRSLWVSSAVEVGVPLLFGAAIGAGLARLAAGWSVSRLDPLPRLRPPSLVVTPTSALVAAGLAAVITAIVLAMVTVWATRRGDPMEVSRGTA